MVADKATFIAAPGKTNARSLYGRVMHTLSRYGGVRVFRVFARRIGGAAPSARVDVQLRLLSEEKLLALVDASLDLAPSKIRAAYARGDLCIGAFHGTELLGYCWFAFAAAPHMDRAWVDFPADVVYTYKSFVRPLFRGHGLAAAMYRFADAAAIERGRKRAVICVESHHSASIAAAKRGGFSEAGYAAYAGTRRLHAWCSPAASRCGLRFFIRS